MPSSEDPQPSRRTSPRRENAARLDEVFGQILPDTSSDEREPSWRESSVTSDDWYLDNRPPHH
ncbi:MAG: hypothetical protein GEV04_19220 [Actinophytocola sp.]|nr:hypothetical protein [Actinophytocola sp.]